MNPSLNIALTQTHVGRLSATVFVLVLAVAGARMAPAQATTTQNDEFFERQVRPVLAEHCVACHGPDKQQGGLRLDSKANFAAGGDRGPLVDPRRPDESLLLQAIRYDGDPRMPPKGKLPEKAIRSIEIWLQRGAHWPAEGPAIASRTRPPSAARAEARTHWAFQPLQRHVPPTPRDASRVSTAVDSFVLAKLDAIGLALRSPAERSTLLRRMHFDLHGLPPGIEATAAFEADDAPDAVDRLVDRMLASPRYGERWGRHWLDVARYADTKGYVRLNENPSYVGAWAYRDYVIRSFNEDLPYDRFILEQLAADRLPNADRPTALAAMGFLTLGERFINSQHDIIDDRIDVVTRGLLGLTVTCARCHDHKYDPISSADYYSLHGVFLNSLEPRVPPAVFDPADRDRYGPYLAEFTRRTKALNDFLDAQYRRLTETFRQRAGDYLLAGEREQVQANFVAVMFLVDQTKDLNPVMIQRWGRFLKQSRASFDPVMTPWHQLAAIPQDEFSQQRDSVMASWQGKRPPINAPPINPLVHEVLTRGPPVRDLSEVAARYGQLFQLADERWRAHQKLHPEAARLPDPDWEAVRALLYGAQAPPAFPIWEMDDYLFSDATAQKSLHEQQKSVEDWITSATASADSPPHAMILQDSPIEYPARVFIRGNSSNPGVSVPRQFLEVLSRPQREPFRDGSGRLELARAIVDPRNPLTARVMANRIWLQHFGAALVKTPSDFGLRGEPPTHSELLDHLATRFIIDSWSVKSLHRHILLSDAYRQQSVDDASGRENDPENRWYWRMNRRRLDWEALRDSLLWASDDLDLAMGGRSIDLQSPPFATRRAVYGRIDRQNVPTTMRMFDFVPPDATSPQRHQTTVPQQALFLMNSEFLKERAVHMAARRDLSQMADPNQRVDRAYRLLFGRRPTRDELEFAGRFLRTAKPTPNGTNTNGPFLTPWEEYLQTLLLSNEFHFVD